MKGVCLLSGGIDSAVAAFLMKQKSEVVLLHFITHPNEPVEINKAKRLVKKLDLDLYTLPYSPIQKKISNEISRKHICVICKRTMFKLAEEFCDEINGDFLITGENMGQVASQTLDNLVVLDKAVKLPVMRPLVGWNKTQIVNKSREIGTFEISTEKELGCPIVPKRPAASTELKEVEREEKEKGVEEWIEDVEREVRLEWER